MTWNVRGINSAWKWDSIRNKITDGQCDIVCLQETKKDSFDPLFLRKICPPVLDTFDFLPSVGASGGILIIWRGALFTGIRIFHNEFAITMEFCSRHDGSKWVLTCIYGPCTPEGKNVFLDWFRNIQMPGETDRLILGNFNLIRKEADRNRPRVISLKCSGSMLLLVNWVSMKLFCWEKIHMVQYAAASPP